MTGVRNIREDGSLPSRGTGFNECWMTIWVFVKTSVKELWHWVAVAIVELQTLCWRVPFLSDKLDHLYNKWKLGNVGKDKFLVFEIWVQILLYCWGAMLLNFEPLSSIKGKLYKMEMPIEILQRYIMTHAKPIAQFLAQFLGAQPMPGGGGIHEQ